MSKKPAVVIDLPIILEPYKMLSIINSIDISFSEILVPLPLSFVEVWSPKWRQYTFQIFKDPTLLEADLETFFGFSNGITKSCFPAGLKLLRMAYDKGMVRVIDYNKSMEAMKIGQEILNTDRNFSNFYNVKTGSNMILNINPDLPISEMLLGLQSDDVIPIFGDTGFTEFWHSKSITHNDQIKLEQTPYKINVDGKIQNMICAPEIYSLTEIFNYTINKNYFSKIDFELSKTINEYKMKKEIGLMVLEFASTGTIDNAIFKGLPVSSAAVLMYKINKCILNKGQVK